MKYLLILLLSLSLYSCSKKQECYTCSIQYEYDTKIHLDEVKNFDKDCYLEVDGLTYTPFVEPMRNRTYRAKIGEQSYRDRINNDSVTVTIICE